MMFSANDTAQFLSSLGSYAIFGSLVISILIAIAGVLPSIFVTGANVILFGAYKGFLVSWLGEVIGAVISFYLYRWGFKQHTTNLSVKYRALDKLLTTKGFNAALLLFQARVIPFIPSGVVTLAAALSSINIYSFSVATALGKLPSLMIEAIISYDLYNIDKKFLRLTTTIIILILSYIVYRLRLKKLLGK